MGQRLCSTGQTVFTNIRRTKGPMGSLPVIIPPTERQKAAPNGEQC